MGFLQTFFSINGDLSCFKNSSNSRPNKIGSVGKNKPILPFVNSSRFTDRGARNATNKNVLSK